MESNIELTEIRSENTKTYYKGDDKYQLVSTRTPIHYLNADGKYKDIDMRVQNGRIDRNIYKAEILTDCIGYSVQSRKDGGRIDVKLKGYNYTTPTTSGNLVTWKDVDTDLDIVIEFRPMWIRLWKVLKSDKAPKTFEFEIFDDVQEKELKVRDKIIGYDANNRQTISSRTESKKVEIVTELSNNKVNTYVVTETFEDKVIVRDPKTRIKSETFEVEYPVRIDADVEVSVTASADDGTDRRSASLTTFTTPTASRFSTNDNDINLYNYFYNEATWDIYILSKGFTRFNGITIPQSATIDDATLNVYYDIGPGNVKIYAFDENDPNAPTAVGDVLNKTTGIASNVVTSYLSHKAVYTLKGLDVSDIVQELVNSYDYSNEAMLFFFKKSPQNASGGATIFIYAYNQGTTKCPELVINYTVAEGWSHKINTISTFTKINGISSFTKINGVS